MDKKHGLQLGILGHQEDRDFADDLALISETIKHRQLRQTDRKSNMIEYLIEYLN